MTPPPRSIAFTVPGTPRPKQRARRNPATGRWFTPARTLQFEREVAWYARQAMRRCPGVRFPLENAVRLYCDFYGPNPRSDVDNIVKAIADGITASKLWKDDAQVIAMAGEKHPAQPEHAYPSRSEVRLYVIGGEEPDPNAPHIVGFRNG